MDTLHVAPCERSNHTTFRLMLVIDSSNEHGPNWRGTRPANVCYITNGLVAHNSRPAPRSPWEGTSGMGNWRNRSKPAKAKVSVRRVTFRRPTGRMVRVAVFDGLPEEVHCTMVLRSASLIASLSFPTSEVRTVPTG